MKVLINFEVTKGYDQWKSVVKEHEDTIEGSGAKIIWLGAEKNNPKKVHVCFEVESLEKLEETMKRPEIAALREPAGRIEESTVVIPLVD